MLPSGPSISVGPLPLSYTAARSHTVLTVDRDLCGVQAIDAQIARVSKLAKLFAHRENVESAGGSSPASAQGGLGSMDAKMYVQY